jgi:hypothetical protein
MIHKKGSHIQYLQDFKDGRIRMGLGIGNNLDHHLRFKRKQLNIILGHDNVGKTYFTSWYFLTLSMLHNIKWCIWSGENQHGQIIRDMVQMLSGTDFSELSYTEINMYSNYIEQYFDFVDNRKLYKPNDLLKIFEDGDYDACLIDPYTGLERSMDYADNYKFLNDCRHFTNSTGKTIYINTHPVTESGRSGNIYAKEHMWAGHLKPPMKSHVEGGKPFTNRADDIIVLHRLTQHRDMKFYTMINIEKIRDTDTGGKQTNLDEPVLCEYNFGKGFVINGVDSLNKIRTEINQTKQLWEN